MEPLSFDNLPDAVKLLLDKVERIEKLVLNLQPSGEGTNKMMNIQEAAEFLNVTVTALYTLVSRKDIPVNKPGKRLYFDKEELIEWIRAGKKKTMSEIEQAASKHADKYRRKFNR